MLFRSIGTAWSRRFVEAIFFLCSERASYTTEQTIGVDGGFEATGIGLPALRANVHSERSAGEDQPSEPDASLYKKPI